MQGGFEDTILVNIKHIILFFRLFCELHVYRHRQLSEKMEIHLP